MNQHTFSPFLSDDQLRNQNITTHAHWRHIGPRTMTIHGDDVELSSDKIGSISLSELLKMQETIKQLTDKVQQLEDKINNDIDYRPFGPKFYELEQHFYQHK